MHSSTTIEILDGALGTVLIDNYNLDASTSATWGGNLIKTSPETLQAVHRSYAECGAGIIETATYQCSFETFKRDGIEHDEAISLFRRSVQLVNEVRQSFSDRTIKCALSLGPFGATCVPGREYSGDYPAPFQFDVAHPEKHVNGLKEWHGERLKALYTDLDTWKNVDIIAFETIPRRDEVRAIAELMHELELRGVLIGKEWWIALVFPDGNRPDRQSFESCIDDCFEKSMNHGIGINCTKPQYLSTIVGSFTKRLLAVTKDTRPTLVIYPDGGLVYNPETQEWFSPDSTEAVPAEENSWAAAIMEVVKNACESGVWNKIIVGGCCKAVMGNIRVLRRLVDEYEANNRK